MNNKKWFRTAKFLTYIVVMALLYILQTTPGFLTVFGVKPNFVIPAAVCIAMYEGEINMVIHGGGGQITVEVAADAVTMKLVDHGPGIRDISLAMQEGWSTAPEEVRNLGFGAGMGLPNMKKYSDEMEVVSEVGVGTTVNMKVYVA